MQGPTKTAALRTAASPLNLVAVGRKLDRIHNYEASLLEADNRHRADRRGDQCSMGVAVATGAVIWGNGFGFAQKIL
jgi:hypothetical protein